MRQVYSAAICSLAIFTMTVSIVANASPLDCATPVGANAAVVQCVSDGQITPVDSAPALSEAVTTEPAAVTPSGFHINQARNPRALPESAPLLILFAALITTVLIRAKSHNSK